LPKIVSFSPLPSSLVRNFFGQAVSKYGLDVQVVAIDKFDKALIQRELSDADYVIGDYSFAIPITQEMVDVMTKVRLIQQPSTGYNHIDIEACKKKGIPVSNIGGANAISVAEHSIALALVLLKRITYAHQKILEGEWAQSDLMNVASELFGKTWGIIGLGRIGGAVSERVRALGGKTIYYDVNRLSEDKEEALGILFRPLKNLLSESDIVSIHTPLTTETMKLIGEKELRFMKPTAVFVNPSRGELVDEEALGKALREGWIAGAGVDVFTKEPPPKDNPLIIAARDGAPIVLTPHIAGATNEARQRIIGVTVENILRVMLGQKPENVVNP
jgi:phosphoglycerate dehydrogenase-like enzyme